MKKICLYIASIFLLSCNDNLKNTSPKSDNLNTNNQKKFPLIPPKNDYFFKNNNYENLENNNKIDTTNIYQSKNDNINSDFETKSYENHTEYLLDVIRNQALGKKIPYKSIDDFRDNEINYTRINYESLLNNGNYQNSVKIYNNNNYTIDIDNINTNNKIGNYINPNANPDIILINGYYRNDGTYVKPHIKTSPNNTKTDNLYYPYR